MRDLMITKKHCVCDDLKFMQRPKEQSSESSRGRKMGSAGRQDENTEKE